MIKSQTLHGQERLHHIVTFNANGGSIKGLAQVFVLDGQAVDRPTDPTKADDNFTGWYTAKDLATEFDFNAPITKPIILLAGWLSKQGHPHIYFNANGGTLGGSARVFVRKGQTVDRPADPTIIGRNFAGWYTDGGASKNRFDFNTLITEPITLYAGWDWPEFEMEMVWIAPSIFNMGQVDVAELVHQVMLTRSFHMGKYPAELRVFMEKQGYIKNARPPV